MVWKKNNKAVVKRVKKEKIIKEKKIVEKPYNSGTMTKSMFFSFIRSCLRQKSRWWRPIQEAKKLGRRNSQSKNKRLKFEYQCSECKNWFPEKEIDVHHLVEAGTLKDYNDLPLFVKNLFCEVDGLVLLCKMVCHAKATQEYKNSLKLEKLNGSL